MYVEIIPNVRFNGSTRIGYLSARGDVEGDLETVAKSSFQRREILFKKKKIEFRGNVKISDLTST